ncbi:hypothetical protein F5Y13DRAFT_205997 [Hypoxylon sp. FL1857]|nr:hypothetical protein F5Y13DRAFT_205997 [Hypoxylon sp. FL1857]
MSKTMTRKRKKEKSKANQPVPSGKPRRIREKASSSESDVSSPAPGTLGYLFYSLPQELRDKIFAWLLVRPAKWDREHKASCPLLAKPLTAGTLQPYMGYVEEEEECATLYLSTAEWRKRDPPIYVDPRRSRWAPPQLNPYLCTYCYDCTFRQPYIFKYSLPCPCARYDHLQTLLVCRRWYEEAGRVFYTQNWFSFSHVEECALFLKNVSPRWKPFITKVSLLHFAIGDVALEVEEEFTELEIATRGKGSLAEVWRLLRSLPALTQLELDAIFLTRLDCVQVFRGPAFKNLSQVHFTQSDPAAADALTRRFIWPRRALRWSDENNKFAAITARQIKGDRDGWVKGAKQAQADAEAVKEEKTAYQNRIVRRRMHLF